MGNKYKMLIADDLEINRVLLKNIFDSEFQIYSASDGEEAMNIIHREGDDLSIILLDLNMPVKSGYDVMREMKNDSLLANIAVVVVTALDDKEACTAAITLGAVDYITTPFDSSLVKMRIDNIVSRIENAKLKAMQDEFERYKLMREFSQTMICEFNIKTNQHFISENLTYFLPGDYTHGRRISAIWKENDVIDDAGAEKLQGAVEDIISGKISDTSMTMQLRTKGGKLQWFKLELAGVPDDYGKCEKLFLILNNVNREYLAVEVARERSEVITMISNSMNVGLKISNCDDILSLHYVGDNLPTMLGYTKADFMRASGGTIFGAIYKPDREITITNTVEVLKFTDQYQCEYRIIKKDGTLMWVQDTGRKFVDNDGQIRVNSVLVDITQLKTAMERLRIQARYDALTGLYNKDTFYFEVNKMLFDHSDQKYMMVCLDIEHFKIINDLYGNSEGDKLLKFIADNYNKEFLNFGCKYARLSSDVFAICAPSDIHWARDFTQKIKKLLNEYPLDFTIMPAIGVYHITDISLPVSIMCDRAILALNSVKGNYTKDYAVYSESQRKTMLAEQEIVNDMHGALEGNQFTIYLQPQFNHNSGKIVGAEALVRWIHPTKGLISPAIFIPVFEKNGFIMKLDEYVWDLTAARLRQWIDKGNDWIPVSVNISRIDLYNPNLIKTIDDILKKYNLEPDMFRLEITETAFSQNPNELVQIVKDFHQHGYTVEMDDFGAGYSSLNILKDVPVDILKIDMNFLAGDDNTGKGGSILNSIVRMAKWLKMSIIAEGVETKKQADFLKSIGCYNIQGYYYSKPIPVPEFEAMLMKNRTEDFNKAQEAVTSNIDVDTFWDPNAQQTLIFNTYIGAAGIFEYFNDNIEVLRVNDTFFKTIRMSREEYSSHRFNVVDSIFKEDRPVLERMISKAIKTMGEVESETRWHFKKRTLYLRLRAKIIASTSGRYVIYVSFENTTKERTLEKARIAAIKKQHMLELTRKHEEEKYRLIVENTAAIVLEWDFIKHLFNAPDAFSKYKLSLINPYDILSKNFSVEIVHPDDINILNDYVRAITTEHMNKFATMRLAKIDGTYEWCKLGSVLVGSFEAPDRLIITITVVDNEIRAQKQLANTKDMLTNIIDYIPSGICILSCKEDNISAKYISNRLYDIFECTKADKEIVSSTIIQSFKTNIDGDTFFEELELLHSTHPIWVRIKGRMVVENGIDTCCYCLVSDITDETKKNRYYIQREEQYRILSDSENSITFDYDIDRDVLEYDQWIGKKKKHIIKHDYLNIYKTSDTIFSDDLETYKNAFYEASLKVMDSKLDFRARLFSNEFVWCRAVYSSVADKQGHIFRIVGRIDDIDTDINKITSLMQKSRYDEMTGLYSKHELKRIITEYLSATPTSVCNAMIMIDIDNFKLVNDTFGHISGDEALIYIAKELLDVFCENSIIGRFGGDEFVIFIKDTNYDFTTNKIEEFFKRVTPERDENKCNVTCSVGISFSSRIHHDYLGLVTRADAAMYDAKKAGKNRWTVFSHDIKGHSRIDSAHTDERRIPTGTFNERLPNVLYDLGATDEAAYKLIEMVAKHYDISDILISRLDDGTILYRYNSTDSVLSKMMHIDYASPVIKEIKWFLESSGQWICSDTEGCTGEMKEHFKKLGIRSEINLPVTIDESLCATATFIQLGNNHPWGGEEIEACRRVARLVSMILTQKQKDVLPIS